MTNKSKTLTKMNYKCHFCKECLGRACIGELPGMGGVKQNENFIANCVGWKNLLKGAQENDVPFDIAQKVNELCALPLTNYVRLAPMTGAQENIGWQDEQSFYTPFLRAVDNCGISLSIGDGVPNEKLLYGIKAVEEIKSKTKKNTCAVFLKPYPNNELFKRIELSLHIADFFGIDIDSYNIITMRNKVHLEKKTVAQLKEVRSKISVPFVLKGIFTKEDLELVKEFKPDVVYVSNHGGRIETRKGSTADFLIHNILELKKYCGAVWVDGGLRTKTDIAIALACGAGQVLIGRPFASAFCRARENGVQELVQRWS